MPTLGDLKARIIAETNRDDLGAGEALEAPLTSCINQAIEHFSGEEFWFTRAGEKLPGPFAGAVQNENRPSQYDPSGPPAPQFRIVQNWLFREHFHDELREAGLPE